MIRLFIVGCSLLISQLVWAQCTGFNITNVSSTNVSCYNGSDGTITVTTTGGAPPYQYSIGGTGTPVSGPETFDNATSLATGLSTTAKFWSPSSCTTGGLNWNASNGCPGGAVGFSGAWNNYFGCFLRSPEINATGLTEVVLSFDISHSYSASHPNNRMRFYVWDNNFSSGSHYYPATSVKINGVEVGVTDINGILLYYTELRSCVHVEVTYDLATIPNDNRLLFYLEPSSGYNNSHVFYTWIDNVSVGSGANYQGSNQFTGLPAGNYDVVVQDTNGCIASFTNNPVVITQPSPINASLSISDATTVGGSEGTAQATVSGGTSPYMYTWSRGIPGFNPAGVFNLSAGLVCVTVTDDNNCDTVLCGTVNEPGCGTFNVSISNIEDVSCQGATDGSITVLASGGISPYRYSLNSGATYQSSNIFNGLGANSYSILVEDTAGCSLTGNATVNEPLAISIAETHTDVLCYGDSTGSIDVTVSGGTTSYSYNWSNGAITEDQNGLPAEAYTLTVTDANTCTSTTTVTITEPSELALSLTVTNETAPGSVDGSVDLIVSGGTLPYSFLWNTLDTTDDLTNLDAGEYCVTVTDGNGCEVVGCDSVRTLQLGCFGFAIQKVTHTDISCDSTNNGTIAIDVLAGAPPVSYSIDSGMIFQTNGGLFTNLAQGTYNIIIRDNIGCEVIYNKNPVLVEAPDPVVPLISESMGTLTASGGVGYQWYFNGSAIGGATMPTHTALQSGDYYALVSNADSCKAFTDTLNVTVSGISVIDHLRDFMVYPNPAQDQLNISWPQIDNKKVDIEILDLFGRVVLEMPLASNNRQTIDISPLSESLYWIRIKVGDKIYYRKFLKS